MAWTSNTSILSKRRLGVIGGGVMAKSILFPLFDQGILDPANVIVGGNTTESLNVWADRGCTVVFKNNGKVLEKAKVILWAVKPHIFPSVADSLLDDFRSSIIVGPSLDLHGLLHISVMVGITLHQFRTRILAIQSTAFEMNIKCCTIRTMPNIGHRVGAGCTVFTMGPEADENYKAYVHALFSPTGLCLEVPEYQINAFGALTGSGIGFMFPIMEAMSDGAVKMGLPRKVALKMAAQTMKGAAELFLKEGTHLAVLKDSVCSPGGSTIAGIAEIEKSSFRIGLINAIEISKNCSEDVGKL